MNIEFIVIAAIVVVIVGLAAFARRKTKPRPSAGGHGEPLRDREDA